MRKDDQISFAVNHEVKNILKKSARKDKSNLGPWLIKLAKKRVEAQKSKTN